MIADDSIPSRPSRTVGTSIVTQQLAGLGDTPATGATAGGRTEILSGLTGSERIAGTGAFVLKAELAKGEAEHGH